MRILLSFTQNLRKKLYQELVINVLQLVAINGSWDMVKKTGRNLLELIFYLKDLKLTMPRLFKSLLSLSIGSKNGDALELKVLVHSSLGIKNSRLSLFQIQLFTWLTIQLLTCFKVILRVRALVVLLLMHKILITAAGIMYSRRDLMQMDVKCLKKNLPK